MSNYRKVWVVADDDEDEEGEKAAPKGRGPLEEQIENALLAKRRIFFSKAVTNESATECIRKLWFLELKDPGKPITLIIHSPGGSVDAGFALWDQIKMLKSPLNTVVTGLAASMGSVMSLAASPGRRFATPNARIMVHQPSIHSEVRGGATDLEIFAKEMLKTRSHFIKLYSSQTGRSTKEIEQALEQDTWMSAEEAKEFGLLDKIINSYDEL